MITVQFSRISQEIHLQNAPLEWRNQGILLDIISINQLILSLNIALKRVFQLNIYFPICTYSDIHVLIYNMWCGVAERHSIANTELEENSAVVLCFTVVTLSAHKLSCYLLSFSCNTVNTTTYKHNAQIIQLSQVKHKKLTQQIYKVKFIHSFICSMSILGFGDQGTPPHTVLCESCSCITSCSI